MGKLQFHVVYVREQTD